MPRIRKRAPRKRNNRKRNFRKRANRRVRRRGVGNFTHLGHNLTLPKSMMIKQDYQFQGYIPSGVTSGFFDVLLNSSYLPFHPSDGSYMGAVTGVSSFTAAANGSGVMLSGSSIDNQSQDYSKITSIYQQARVLKSKISVNVIPQALSDAINLYVTPYVINVGLPGGEAAGSTADFPLNDTSQSMAPRTKNKMCVANVASQSRNTLHYSQSVSGLLGVAKRVVMDDPSFLTVSGVDDPANNNLPSVPGTLCSYRIFWLTTDAAVLSAKLPFHVKLTTITKFSSTENRYIQ